LYGGLVVNQTVKRQLNRGGLAVIWWQSHTIPDDIRRDGGGAIVFERIEAMRTSLKTGELVEITTLAERPDLAGAEVDVGEWPEFMRHNRISGAYFRQSVKVFPETCLIATSQDGAVVADAHAVRFASGGPGRDALPAGGWEQVVVWAFADAARAIMPNTACALSISVAASHQGQGLAGLMLDSLRNAGRDLGLSSLVAPVRPTWKDREPRTSMGEYIARTREDRLPYHPWLRTHVRAGGRDDRRRCAGIMAGGRIAFGMAEMD
jgi:GNAT superfamily N-acetyltransferase